MMTNQVSVVMADDDADDFFLMRATLEEQRITNPLHHIEGGRQLLDFLTQHVDTTTGGRSGASMPGNALPGSSLPGNALPGLIFLDINMPGMNGLEVLEKLKSNARLRAIPVVMFSTVSNPETVQRAYQLGANSFITKPNSMQGMVEVVRCVKKCFLELPAVAV